MARHIIEQITDDLDGSSGAQAYTFAWQGTEYSIDLSSKNAKAFEKAIKPYVEVATKVSGRARKAPSKGGRRDLAAVRTWAKSQKFEVADRGRVSAEVLSAYDAAH